MDCFFKHKNRRKIRKKAAQVERKCHFKRRLCNYNIHTLPLGMLTLPLLQIVIIAIEISWNDWLRRSPNTVRSLSIFSVVILQYFCVVTMFVCPRTRLTLSIGTPLLKASVANPWRAVWNIQGEASESKQVMIKRNTFKMSNVSVFC